MSTATPTTTERQLTEQGRERKQQLVDAAMALFTERGYAATRISDICTEAGVAKGLFYWYFPTKVDLFSELVRTMRQRLRRAQADAVDPGATALERIVRGAEASVIFIAEHAHYFALVEVERADPAIAEALRGTTRVYLDESSLSSARPRKPDKCATRILGLAFGVLATVSSFGNSLRTNQLQTSPRGFATFVGAWIERSLA